jgi:hypothetical protein
MSNRFVEGLTYDVGTTLASYLLSLDAAVPVGDDQPALVLPIEHFTGYLRRMATCQRPSVRHPRLMRSAIAPNRQTNHRWGDVQPAWPALCAFKFDLRLLHLLACRRPLHLRPY